HKFLAEWIVVRGSRPDVPDTRRLARLLRTRRKRPRRRAAECDQQLPPSDGDCHTPLPCEVRKGNDTTPRVCSLHVQGAGCWLLPPLSCCPKADIRTKAETQSTDSEDRPFYSITLVATPRFGGEVS